MITLIAVTDMPLAMALVMERGMVLAIVGAMALAIVLLRRIKATVKGGRGGVVEHARPRASQLDATVRSE